jgi:hypothetical protein
LVTASGWRGRGEVDPLASCRREDQRAVRQLDQRQVNGIAVADAGDEAPISVALGHRQRDEIGVDRDRANASGLPEPERTGAWTAIAEAQQGGSREAAPEAARRLLDQLDRRRRKAETPRRAVKRWWERRFGNR